MREREKLRDVQKKQACSYNTSAHDLPTLEWGDTVRINLFIQEQKEWKKGVVVERLDEGSYKVETTDGSSYRRNRVHFNKRMSRPLSCPSRNHPKHHVILMTPVTEHICRNRLTLRKPYALSHGRTQWRKTLLE